MSEDSSGETETIAPYSESGFGPVDVLERAEKGNSIELEMDFYDAPFESVKGTVLSAQVRDTTDDGRMKLKNIHVDAAGEFETVVLNVKFDSESAHNLLQENVRFSRPESDEYEYRAIDDLAMCRINRAAGATDQEAAR